MSSRFQPNEGDWICGDSKCGNVNFSRRTECNKCGKANKDGTIYKKGGVEIGKHMAEKSKGLFSADDWQCKSCGNVNWARRMTCNMCNAPKYGKNEARTGLGGGYNERGEVTYKERNDSDDEFDEFGRKKKKYRNLPNDGDIDEGKKSEPAIPQTEDADDDEEDEDGGGDASKYNLESDEDDDEDADLSKYALDSDDDTSTAPGKDSAPPDNKNRDISRSGSPSSSSSSSSSSSGSLSASPSQKRHASRSRSSSPVSKKKRSSPSPPK